MKENSQTDFFKSLQNLIENFKNKGIREVKTIALVYQFAFKIIEQEYGIKPPMQYSYTELAMNKEIVKELSEELSKCSAHLLIAIQENNAFVDLIGDYIENSRLTNKNLAQCFTPKKASLSASAITLKFTPLERFEENKYFLIGDNTGCGVGTLILDCLASIKDNVKGFEDIHYQSLYVILNDIDEDLSKIAFFQILLSSLLHAKPIGVIQVESKDIISEYEETKNLNIFIANIQRYGKYLLQKHISQ